MEAVIDTMVFAYGLLNETEYAADSFTTLARTNTIHVPDSVRAELTNVIWQWITHKSVAVKTGLEVLQDAGSLFSKVYPANHLWEDALIIAVDNRHPAYDTLFVALAQRLNLPLVTYDKTLLNLFSAVAIRPDTYLRSLK